MSITFDQLPGPKGLPFIGNLHQINLSKLHAYFEKQALQYGDVFKVKLGPVPLTVISKPEMIHRILKSRPTHFRRLSKLDKVLKEVGVHGVFNAEGEDWKVHRRIVTRGLDIRHQQQFFPSMSAILNRLYAKMSQAADADSTYAIQEDLLKFTVDVTTSLAFGVEMNTLEKKGGVIQDHMEKIFPVIFKRINSPFPLYKIYKTKEDKAFSRAMEEIEKQVHHFIEAGREKLLQNPVLKDRPENILEALLVAAEEEEAITDKEIKGNLLTLLMAGEDTTAHSLAWAIYLICLHPGIQHRLQAEADDVLGQHNFLPEYTDHDRLTYTAAVINETMRLKSVAPVLLVEPLEDMDIDQYRFRKGTKIALLARSGALRSGYFSDSEQLNPDRWIRNAEHKCPVHNLEAFLPFGSGPRLCPGKNLALLEMKLVLSMIARNFNMELVTPAEEVGENMAFTMMPGKFDIRLTRR